MDGSPRSSPNLYQSMSSRLSSQDKREMDDIDDSAKNLKPPTPPSGKSSPTRGDNSESEFELVSGPGSVIGRDERQDERIDLQLENRLLRQERSQDSHLYLQFYLKENRKLFLTPYLSRKKIQLFCPNFLFKLMRHNNYFRCISNKNF